MKLIRAIWIDKYNDFDTDSPVHNLVIRRTILNSKEIDRDFILILDLLKEDVKSAAEKIVLFLKHDSSDPEIKYTGDL